jgi:hypothetical protein
MGKFNFRNDYKKEWFKQLLRTEEVEVTFTKKDGTERVMRCSLNENDVPSFDATKPSSRRVSKDVIAVVDLDKKEWRSIRWDSMKIIKFSLGTATYDENVV